MKSSTSTKKTKIKDGKTIEVTTTETVTIRPDGRKEITVVKERVEKPPAAQHSSGGSSQKRFCTSCGKHVIAGARFCEVRSR